MRTGKRASTRESVPLPEGVRKRLTAYALAARSALPEGVDKRLTAYALAAGAAGVGVLALAEPARADIVTVTTPISIGCCSFDTFLKINGNNVLAFYNVDREFFTGPSSHPIGHVDQALNVFAWTNRVGVLGGPLAKGAAIGPGANFGSGGLLEARTWSATLPGGRVLSYKLIGAWANKSGYLGFKFLSNGQTHFGWAHLNATAPPLPFGGPLGGSISEFAYDTVPGQTIRAGQTSAIPEPGTLSLLALGAAGLAVLRKRKVSAVSPPQ